MAKLWLVGSCLLFAAMVIMADMGDSSMEDSVEDDQMDGSVDPSAIKDNAYQMAEYCDPEVCVPPSCRCGSTVLTDKIPVEQIPQVNYFKYYLIKENNLKSSYS